MYFATFDIDESDAEDLLFVYILEDEIDFIPSLFNDRINIPEKNNDLKYNKEKSILKDKTNAIEKQVIETRNTEKQSNEYSLLENNNNRKSKETKEDSNCPSTIFIITS